MKNKVEKMFENLDSWIVNNNYKYVECNSVPSVLRTNNRHINALLRLFFKIFPYNLRIDNESDYVVTPQTCVSLLKAYCYDSNYQVQRMLFERMLKLRSTKTKYFSISQGISISVRMYENSKDDPTPLNTVWFGEYLLEATTKVISEHERKELLISISNYLIEELGYKNYLDKGVFFYYGPTLQKEVYNASAIISSFLIKVGTLYSICKYKYLGERGIKYILSVQNDDGSWFYAGYPCKKSIDNFHMSYVLQALISIKDSISFDISKEIELGIQYYLTLFKEEGRYTIPIRYDKRYVPYNTWLLLKVDGRDISEAIVFFTKYYPNEKIVDGLVNYLYDKMYNKNKGYFYPNIFIYGKNYVPYMEFQGWYLNALQTYKRMMK